jgi:hypothetical protein
MLDLKCVYCPARGPNTGKCFKNKDKSKIKFLQCQQASADCDYNYSDKAALRNDDLAKETIHAS